MTRGGARAGAGRPEGSGLSKDPRNVNKAQRYTAEEWDYIEKAAEKAGITPGEFTRGAAVTAAKWSLEGGK